MENVSVLIVAWNSSATLCACLESLPPGLDVILVDNHSSDATVSLVREAFPSVRIIESATNLGFGAACNLAARYSTRDFYLLLNPDAALVPGALDVMIETLVEHPRCGAVGPRLLGADGRPELSWGRAPTPREEWIRREEQLGRKQVAVPQELTVVDWVSGACMLLRAEAWRAVDGFDEGFFLYFEDLDLCRRLALAEWLVLYQPAAMATHLRGKSSSQIASQVEVWYRSGQLRYYKKHNSRWDQLVVRGRLVAKFARRALQGDADARRILRLVLGATSRFRVT